MFGVSVDTLRRRIRDNQLDEAQLVQGPFGATWVLPRESLAVIAARENWEVSEERSSPRFELPPPPAEDEPGELRASMIDLTGVTEATTLPAAAPAADSSAPVAGPPTSWPRTGEARLREPTPDQDGVGSHDVVARVSAIVSEDVARLLAENVESELKAVREAITAAEVRAVAAEARSEALRGEQGSMQAQLKRAEADAEYWRSQHDRLDKELDRERAGRAEADRARAVADTETREARQRVAELMVEVADAADRERTLVASDAAASADLELALASMGWWAQRKLARLQARSPLRAQRYRPGE